MVVSCPHCHLQPASLYGVSSPCLRPFPPSNLTITTKDLCKASFRCVHSLPNLFNSGPARYTRAVTCESQDPAVFSALNHRRAGKLVRFGPARTCITEDTSLNVCQRGRSGLHAPFRRSCKPCKPCNPSHHGRCRPGRQSAILPDRYHRVRARSESASVQLQSYFACSDCGCDCDCNHRRRRAHG